MEVDLHTDYVLNILTPSHAAWREGLSGGKEEEESE